MTAQLLDGKALAESVRADVRIGAVEFFAKHGRPPALHVLVVGDDPASLAYTRMKERAANEVGLRGVLHALPRTTTEDEIERLVARLDADEAVDGILVQLPLPATMNAVRVTDRVDADKDVDGLHPENIGRLASGRRAIVPCTPSGCMKLIAKSGVALRGARAVVVGRGNLVGRPVAQLLLREDATVTFAHAKTRDLPTVCREADVLVVAAGRPELVRGDWIKPGAVVIDVGNTRIEPKAPGEKARVLGDVCFEEAKERASFLTPVPGGVGPMTIACLLENTLIAARRRVGDD